MLIIPLCLECARMDKSVGWEWLSSSSWWVIVLRLAFLLWLLEWLLESLCWHFNIGSLRIFCSELWKEVCVWSCLGDDDGEMQSPDTKVWGGSWHGEESCDTWLVWDDWDAVWLETKVWKAAWLTWEDWDMDRLDNEAKGGQWLVGAMQEPLRQCMKDLEWAWPGDDAREEVWVGEDDRDIVWFVNRGFEQLLLDCELVSDPDSGQWVALWVEVVDGEDKGGRLDFWKVKIKFWSWWMASRTSSSFCCRLSFSKHCAWKKNTIN